MNQPNGRVILIFVGGANIACLYTSKRQAGMTINEMMRFCTNFRSLTYLGSAGTEFGWGYEYLIGCEKKGRSRVLALGG